MTDTRRTRTVLKDDPTLEGWHTETFSRATDRQLDVLRKLIVGEAKDFSILTDVVAVDFTCPSLRPSEFDEVFRDEALTVRRYKPTSQRIAATTIGPTGNGELHADRGLTRCRNALVAFVEPLSAADDLRAKLKTVRVLNQETGMHTVVLVQLSGTTQNGSMQQNATWLCRWSEESSERPRLTSIEVKDYAETLATTTTKTLMSDCTEAVLSRNKCFEDQLLIGIPTWLDRLDANVAIGTFGRSGLAIGDVNGDGLDDVYVCQTRGLPNRMFLQQPDGTVSEAAARLGVDWIDASQSALLVDLDNDGDQDLAVSLGRHVLLLSNDGKGQFAEELSLPLSRPAFSLSAVDFDHDGRLDLYACVYFSSASDPGKLADPLPYYDAQNGGRNVLWRNEIRQDESPWTFRDVTQRVGLEQNNNRWSLASSWEDYDNDGDMDVYVANDFGRNNLYRNELLPSGEAKFTDVAAAAEVEDGSFGMSVTWADYDHDGYMDLYVSNMFSAAGNRITYQRRFKPETGEATRRKYQYMARGNSLFRGTADHSFEDVSLDAGVAMGRWAWASRFMDINNDSWDDLIVTNGYLTNELEDDL